MSDDARQRVEDACAELAAAGQPATFTAVATRARIGRATLYRNPELRALVDEHRARARAREAHTLSGLATEVAQLRTRLEAVATTVRRHDQAIRRLQRATRKRQGDSPNAN
jgi:hypothetical protein